MHLRRFSIFATLLVLISIVGVTWWFYFRNSSPVSFVSSNGRLEAKEIDIATKFQGRVAAVLFQEGETAKAGEIVARMDTKALEAQLREAEARVKQKQKERSFASAVVRQRDVECALAEKELKRSLKIYEREKGAISIQQLDRDRTAVEKAKASCDAAEAHVAEVEAGIEAAAAETERLRADIADGILKAPRTVRIQYRLAEPGEVLGAGGRVLTTIDLNDMYMTLFLPAKEAGKAKIGAEARIVLDALPDQPIPAKVSFVAAEAQFTPKEVETTGEREKLVFRIKLQVLESNDPLLKPGMPGVAYIRVDETARWPTELK